MLVIMEQRNSLGLPVRLRVLKVNARAVTFYKRLGFEITDETDTHFLMRHEGSLAPDGTARSDFTRREP